VRVLVEERGAKVKFPGGRQGNNVWGTTFPQPRTIGGVVDIALVYLVGKLRDSCLKTGKVCRTIHETDPIRDMTQGLSLQSQELRVQSDGCVKRRRSGNLGPS